MAAPIVAGGEFDLLTRNMTGDRPALRLVLLFVRQPQLRSHLGDGNLARFQGQLKLIDRLGRGAEAMATVTGQLVAKLLDQHRLRLYLGQQKSREAAKLVGIFR